MKILATPAVLARLFGGPLMVFDEPPPPRDTGALFVCWLDTDQRLRAAEDDDGPPTALEALPLGCVALVALSPGGARRLAALQAEWREAAPASTPALVDLSGRPAGAVAALAVAEASAERIAQAMREAAELTRQVVASREEVERLAKSLRDLAVAPQQAAPVFEALPGDAVTPAGDRIRQRLPLTARGLAALDVYVAGSTAGGDRPLELELWRLEEDALLGRFAVPSPMQPQWQRFVLGAAADCAEGTIELRVRLPIGLRLALAQSRIGVAEPAYAESAGALEGPLALRVYGDAPGRQVALRLETADPPELAERIATLEREIASLRAQHAQRISAFERSTSWRITAPLRAVMHALRGRRSP
jgi:hypothetical protein